MSSHPITLILNANQSKRSVFLLPADTLPAPLILQEARKKLRVNALRVVYLPGGSELGADAESLEPHFSAVYLGKGEPYAGRPASRTPRAAQPDVRVRLLATESFVDTQARAQLEALASLDGVRACVGLPDLHPGARFPVGCAVAAAGVYPALVGSDIGCGIALYRLHRMAPNADRLAARLVGLDAPWAGDVRAWLADYGIVRDNAFDASSLGTVGGGNHFAEIVSVEEIVDCDAAVAIGVEEDGIYLLMHSGSRGLGGAILAGQTAAAANPYLAPDSPEQAEYLVEHDYAVQWAVANRDLIAHRVQQCLRGAPADDDAEPTPATLGKPLDVTHNAVVRRALRVNSNGDAAGEDLWIHPKGAAPADAGPVPCPGSRGDFSWLLVPAGDGHLNAHSLAHGAGRRLARAALHAGAPHRETLRVTALGSRVVCEDAALLLEERAEAYKSVGAVVRDMEALGVARGVVRLRPVVSYKVREGAQRRE